MAAQDASTFCAEFSYARRCGKFYTYIHLTGDKAGDPGRVFYVGKGQKTRAWMTNRTKYWKHVADKHGFSVQICAYWDSESDAFLHGHHVTDCLILYLEKLGLGNLPGVKLAKPSAQLRGP